MSPVDLIVAGAGPAGLATALYGTRAGLRVTVMDPRPSPIDKACGEGLMPGAVRALRDLGVDPEGYPLAGIRYTNGRCRADARFRHGPGRGVRRTVLQGALLATAHRVGVEVVAEPAVDVTVDDTGVDVDGYRGRYLAVADGLHSPLRRRLGLGLGVTPPARRPRWGTRQHFAVRPWTDLVEVHWSARAEAYVTPVAPDVVGVAVLATDRRPFAAHLEAFPEVLRRLDGLPVTTVRGAGPLRQRASARVAGRALLVGDAAGYVDALTGEGISIALSCARALVDCVVADDPAGYERRWRTATRRYRWATSTLLWARSRPCLAPRIVPLAARLPRTFDSAVQHLAH